MKPVPNDPSPPPRRLMHPYLELSKARLTLLVLCTTAVGFALAARGRFDAGLFLWTLLGTGLAASGANGLNQWWEARPDGLMERTRFRPIPAHRLTRRHAFLVAAGSGLGGVAILAWKANPLTAALGAFVILLYVLAYTPLKKRTPFCTLVGAVCGAIPPMMGWTAVTREIGFGAWILALTLFLWQIPHFLALAWLYREDYARGGFRMLPSVDPTGRLTGILASVYSAALLPLGSLFFLSGLAGWFFLLGSVALGAALFALGLRLFRTRDRGVARGLFLGSIVYLPLLLLLLLLDPGPRRTGAEVTAEPMVESAPESTADSPAELAAEPKAKPNQTLGPGRRGSTEPLTQPSDDDYRDTNTFSLLTPEPASSRKK